jgi:hypothetical protein
VRATVKGLRQLRRPDEVARLRGLDVNEFAPRPMMQAIEEAEARTRAKRDDFAEGTDGA